MKHYLLLIFAWMAWTCEASVVSPQPPLLTFEIAARPGSELHRVVTRAMKEIFQKLGYRFQSRHFPPMRGLQELKAGRIDGSAGRVGDLTDLLDAKDVIRVDVPIAVFHVSRWCRKDSLKSQRPIKLGIRIGSVMLLFLKDHLDRDNILLEEIGHQKAAVQMLHAGRLDCVLASALMLESDGVDVKAMERFDRFDLATFEVYPWIAKRHQGLKEGLEHGLRHYDYPESFRKKFLNRKPVCEGKLNRLCPDGVIFKNKADLT